MNPSHPLQRFARLCVACTVLFSVILTARAQTSATGTIEGRVFDAGRDEFLEKARLTIDGTTLETFTDAIGHYRFTNVPPGAVTIRVFFTGLPAQSEVVQVTAGSTVQRDVTLRAAKAGTSADTVKMSDFVVSTTREMDAASIAINQQRYAPNITNVVAADEFGVVVDGTPGEVMKFLPGITMEYSAGEARTISMNGVAADYVPVTIDGADVASTGNGSTSRAVSLDSVSVNNLSRVEVFQSPTPESQGAALAGSVNMVSRSAFERSRPEFNYSVAITMKDSERDFKKTPGPMFSPERKITPALNFSAIVPVNKRFGFTLSGNTNRIYQKEDWAQNSWMGSRWATNGTTRPHTTPDKPYLIEHRIHDSTRMSRSTSVGTTLDYRISNNDRISLSFQYTFLGVTHNNRRLDFYGNAVNPGDFDTTWMHGRPGTGEVRISSQTGRDWLGTTLVGSLAYRHNGPIWKAEAGGGTSHQSLHTRDIDKGHFNVVQARRTGVTINFDDVYYLQPGSISVLDASGASIDYHNLDNYSLASANSDPRDSTDAKLNVYANIRRDFHVLGRPLTLKTGVDVRRAMRDSDSPGAATYNYRGPDNRASTTPVGNDDAAGIVRDESFSQRVAPFGFGQVDWIDNREYWQLYQDHPGRFAPIDANAQYRSHVAGSKFAEEIVSAAYLRADLAFFERRLKFTGGIRGEQTNVNAEGPLADATRNYERDRSGNIIDANPNQAGIQPRLIVPTSDALGVSQLTYIARGQQTEKEYLRWFPSINASYNLRENLILRASYYYSVGRPNFNQYAGGLTLPDLSLQPNLANSSRIQVNNAGIKAWSAKSVKVRLEYYFERGGQVSVGAFRRDFYNLFESTTLPVTPDFLGFYGLDPETYGIYEVVTQRNIGNAVRMTGVEFAYKQSLTFLPHWARGVSAFANVSAQRAIDDSTNALNSYVPRTYNWGFSLNRPKYSVHLNWNYRGKHRRGILYPGQSQATTSVEPGTYQWGSKRLYVDLSCEYKFSRRLGLFANFRNLTGEVQDIKSYGPSTPDVATLESRGDYGGIWSFGVKGSF